MEIRCTKHGEWDTDWVTVNVCPRCYAEELVGPIKRCPAHHKDFTEASCPECVNESTSRIMQNWKERVETAVAEEFGPNGKAPSQLGDCLDEAKKTICGERQDVYGSPEDSFAIIAKYWSTYLAARQTDLDAPLDSKDVAHMMVLFKMARVQGQRPSRDNYVDLCGYAAIAADRLSPQDSATKERIDAYNKKAVAEAWVIARKNAPAAWKDGSPGCPHTRTKFVKTTAGDYRQCLGCGAKLKEE